MPGGSAPASPPLPSTHHASGSILLSAKRTRQKTRTCHPKASYHKNIKKMLLLHLSQTTSIPSSFILQTLILLLFSPPFLIRLMPCPHLHHIPKFQPLIPPVFFSFPPFFLFFSVSSFPPLSPYRFLLLSVIPPYLLPTCLFSLFSRLCTV